MPTVNNRPSSSANSQPTGGGEGETIAAIAKALGHPARVHIVRLLLKKQSCIGCDIVDEVGLAQSTVSEHLRILKAAGVITGEIERPRICYSLNPDSLRPLAALLGSVFDGDNHREPGGSKSSPPASGETLTSRLSRNGRTGSRQ